MTAAVLLSIAWVIAVIVMAAAVRSSYRAAGAWFALAIVGQATALLLIEAGPSLRYQHYARLTTLAGTHPLLLTVLAAQAAIVCAALLRRLRAATAWNRSQGIRLAIAVLLSVCTAATVSPVLSRYVSELTFAAFLQVIQIGTIVLMVLALPPPVIERAGDLVTRYFGSASDDHAGTIRLDRFAIVLAGVAVLIAAVLAVFSYERHPHVPDEVVYLTHARTLAGGQFTIPAPHVPRAFDVDIMFYQSDRWFSPVPPGWPAMLAIGVALGVPWLVNPVLAGVNVLLASLLLSSLYPLRITRYATALMALSPWFLFLAMSFMTHMFTLTCALTAAVGVVQARRTGLFRWGAVAGMGVGVASLIRPLDGVVVGVLTAAWSVGLGGRRLALTALAGVCVGAFVTGSLVFPYNRALTGDPLNFPINAYADRYYAKNANAYGFGPDRGLGWPIDPNPGHSPLDAVINANLNTFGLNTDLFGWSTGSLLFVAILLCLGTLSRSDRLMLAGIAAIFVAYFFYYFSGGPDFGARYWFPMLVPLAAMTARGIHTLENTAGTRVTVGVAALLAMALIVFVPWRAIDKYHHFRGMRPDLQALAATSGFQENDLVLVRGDRFPDYAAAFVRNPLDLQAPATIYAWDRDSHVRAEVLRAYPERRVWFVDGPSITGGGYRLVDGPEPAKGLLSADAEGGR